MNHKISEHTIEYLTNQAAPPDVHNRAFSVEIIVDNEGQSHISYYWLIDDGKRVYDGRAWNDEAETAELMSHKLFRRIWEESKAIQPPKDKGD